MMFSFRMMIAVVSLSCLSGQLHAQQDPAVPPTPGNKPGSIGRMDYGPVIAHSIEAKWPAKNIASKGMAIRLYDAAAKIEAVVLYDTDLMRIAAAATGGFIDLEKTNHTSYKGGGNAAIAGSQILGTQTSPGWADPTGTDKSAFDDPRSYRNGPLPKSWTHFKGYYKHGNQVVLHYTVGDRSVMEMSALETIDGYTFLTRTIELGKSNREAQMIVADVDKDFQLYGAAGDEGQLSVWESSKGSGQTKKGEAGRARLMFVAQVAHEQGSPGKLRSEDRRIVLALPPTQKSARIKLLYWMGAHDQSGDQQPELYEKLSAAAKKASPPAALSPLTQGGPAQWKQTVEIKGVLATGKGAYVVDTLTVPEKNPWNSWMRLVALDFFKDGTRAAVSTWNGDVWIVSGIDDKLDKLTWKRFATGLYEPLGLVIKDDVIYALGYDRITRLHDLNGDGEADYHENFHSDWITHPRAYTLCLSTDSQGNFYTIANGNRAHGVPLHGCLYKISSDGSKLDVFATGLRSANGLGISGDDRIAVADQEGNWTPASRIDLVKQGDFVGYKPHAHTPEPPEAYKPPLCWLPKNVDNSAGDLVWVPDDPQTRWGPLKGQLLGMSYGMCKLYVVPFETVKLNDGTPVEQGGVVTLPLNFSSGIMRGRFNARDGQLYLAGLKGWQTRAAFDAGFFRVRYTGEKANLPVAIHPTKIGVKFTFTDALDAEIAEDISSYQVQRWGYVYSEKYGSPEMSIANPGKQGRDAMKVTGASLSKDGKTVTLMIDDMQPVMQMMLKVNLESQQGDPVKHEIYHTVHALSNAK